MLEVLQAELIQVTRRAAGQQKLVEDSKSAMDHATKLGLPNMVKAALARYKRQVAALDESKAAIFEIEEAIKRISPPLPLEPPKARK